MLRIACFVVALCLSAAPVAAQTPAERMCRDDAGCILVFKIEAKVGVSAPEADQLEGIVATALADNVYGVVETLGDARRRIAAADARAEAAEEDTSTLKAVGRALGVPYFVTGDVGRLGDLWTLNLTLADVADAKAVKRITIKIRGTIDQFADKLGAPQVRPLVAGLHAIRLRPPGETAPRAEAPPRAEVARPVEAVRPAPPAGAPVAPPAAVAGPAGLQWVQSAPAAGLLFTRSEVTVEQYRACVTAGACTKPGETDGCNWPEDGREKHPINCVDWAQARTFCKWVGGRLPANTEWEAEAYNGGEREYPWGNDTVATCDYVVMHNEGHGCGVGTTAPVCSKPMGNSVSGLCDMGGNVWEWQTTPTGGDRRIRGGSLENADQFPFKRDTEDYSRNPADRFWAIGFRCAKTP